MDRRQLLTVISGGSMAVIAGCQQSDEDSDTPEELTESSTSISQSTGTPTPNSQQNKEIEDAIEPTAFTGRGSEVVRSVELGEGLVTGEVDHNPSDDSSRIVVKLVEVDGRIERVVYQGRRGESGRGANVVGEGDYHIEVEADGEWSITLSQPRVQREQAETPPIETNGSNSAVVGPYYFDGRSIAEASHTGNLDIIVTVWPMEGPWGEFEMPIMEAGEGPFEGTFFFNGIAWIQVKADGDWTLSIE